MLTKTDLKEIKKIVREETEAESENTKNELLSEMKMNMIRTVEELRELNTRNKNLEIKINKIQKDIKYTVDFLDRDHLKTQKRVQRIEEHLGFEPVSP